MPNKPEWTICVCGHPVVDHDPGCRETSSYTGLQCSCEDVLPHAPRASDEPERAIFRMTGEN